MIIISEENNHTFYLLNVGIFLYCYNDNQGSLNITTPMKSSLLYLTPLSLYQFSKHNKNEIFGISFRVWLVALIFIFISYKNTFWQISHKHNEFRNYIYISIYHKRLLLRFLDLIWIDLLKFVSSENIVKFIFITSLSSI